ncbi:zinc finger CCCH domain-containing protein 13 [Trichonephila clavipes]|nr:zinc finger CCCH domain-containing protein 13 [Trichonephila clavipes]
MGLYSSEKSRSLRKTLKKVFRTVSGATPFISRLSAVTYEVQDFDPASRKRKLREVVHVLRMKPYHDPAEQIETEDIPPKETYKGPITRSRIKTLEQNDSGALSQSPVHGHHGVREIESLTGNRGRIYESDIPPSEREYGYGYDSLHDPYLSDRLLPSDYETDVLRSSSVYPSDVYPESRYRRGGKDSLDRYEPRDVMSPRDVLPHRDIISLTGRGDDYLSDLPIDDRSYDDRWQRGRGRDDWDPYPTLPPAPLPPHVAAALDEDRYGMPRRRRASPDWQRGRMDDRDPSSSHRPGGRVPGPLSEGRSRSPKGPGSNRSSWSDRGGRHDSRSTDGKPYDDPQKDRCLDDRKGRNIRKDRGKPLKDESLTEDKGFSSKEKAPVKRPHSPSPSPPSKIKKRRNDMPFDSRYHGSETSEKLSSGSVKKGKEEIKPDSKPTTNSRVQKSGKQDISSPKIDNTSITDKGEVPSKSANESKLKEKEERKSRKNDDGARGEDDFSDWSDDDDDLLTRDDFVEPEASSENVKNRHKSDENIEDSFRRKERHAKEDLKKDKDGSRTSCKDQSMDDTLHIKDSKAASDGKDVDLQESLSLKEDTATDVDEYVTAESVDYDPISDDELDALIEEPDDTLIKPAVEEKSKIVNALEVDWSTLMSETKTEFVPGFARQRFKAAHVLSRIGFSQVFAGAELTEKIIETCQKQLDDEVVSNEEAAEENVSKEENKKPKKFVMEHPLAAFHVAISQNKQERNILFNKVGPFRRALCARRDLQIRKVLCRPLNKLDATPVVTYTPQYTVVDKELYKQSLELLKLKKPPEVQPQTVDVC